MTAPRAKQLGITDELYFEMLERQSGHCALCPATPKTRRLHVDHDHKTKQVRGLLCMRCNRALPSWITVEWVERVFGYLKYGDGGGAVRG
jgi:hypothetical protein